MSSTIRHEINVKMALANASRKGGSVFSVDHYAISVRDADKSVSFYKVLGFEVIKDWASEDGGLRIVHMQNGGFILEMFNYSDCGNLPDFVSELGTDLKVVGSKHFGLAVEDLDQAGDYLVEKGVLESKPTIVAGRLGRPYFFITDPDGIFVEIILKR